MYKSLLKQADAVLVRLRQQLKDSNSLLRQGQVKPILIARCDLVAIQVTKSINCDPTSLTFERDTLEEILATNAIDADDEIEELELFDDDEGDEM